MPLYRVWYRNHPEPLEFSTSTRYGDEQILEQIVAHENIRAADMPDAQGGDAAAAAGTVKALIARHDLAPVRYTEDESEMQTIG